MARILAHRDEEQLRPEAVDDRRDDLLHRLGVAEVAGPERELDVDVEALALAPADLRRLARLRVGRAPGAVPHVEGDRQHIVALVEALLCAVAVVDVPIDDGDALEASVPGKLGSERAVVEEAVAVCLGGLGVVPGRPHQREGDLALAGKDGLGRSERRPGRGESRPPRALGDDGRPRQPPAAAGAGLPNRLDVGEVVHGGELGRIGVSPLTPAHAAGQGPALEDRFHVEETDGVLRMGLRFGEQRRGRRLEDAAPRVVEQHVVVPEDVEQGPGHYAGEGAMP